MLNDIGLGTKLSVVLILVLVAFAIGMAAGVSIQRDLTVPVSEVPVEIDENHPVQKWIDPDNQAVVYIYPEGYTGQIVPLYSLVPPVWYKQLLQTILNDNDGVMPPEILESVPKEWYDAIAPHNTPEDQGLKVH